MTDEVIAHYQRLLAQHQGGLQQAMCLTYALGIDEDAFIQAFGGDPAATAIRTHKQLGEDLGSYHYNEVPYTLLVTRVGEWLVGIEDNGFQGSRPEVMRGASATGAAVSVYWNVNSSNQFRYNVQGRPMVGFDLSAVDRRWGSEPDALAEHLAGLPFDDFVSRWPAGLALAERITGVRLDEEILAGEFRRAVLTAVPEDLIPEGAKGEPAMDDPFVRSVVDEPTVDKLPAITRFLAHLVAEDAGVQHEPAVREALQVVDKRAAGRHTPASAELLQRLKGLADELLSAAQSGPDPDAFRRMHAVLGVIGALRDDPADSAFQMHWSTSSWAAAGIGRSEMRPGRRAKSWPFRVPWNGSSKGKDHPSLANSSAENLSAPAAMFSTR